MSNFVFLNAMIDASKSSIAKKLRSIFSHHTSGLQIRLKQLRTTSSTQGLAFLSGSRLSSLAS